MEIEKKRLEEKTKQRAEKNKSAELNAKKRSEEIAKKVATQEREKLEKERELRRAEERARKIAQEKAKQLRKERKTPNALISYARSALNYSDERLVSFAVMDIDSQGYLKALVEKPNPETIEKYRDHTGEIRVSMNIFSFVGKQLYPYLKNCPIHPERNEKELPEAIRLLNEKEPNQIECFGVNENILDLTSADDIASFDQL